MQLSSSTHPIRASRLVSLVLAAVSLFGASACVSSYGIIEERGDFGPNDTRGQVLLSEVTTTGGTRSYTLSQRSRRYPHGSHSRTAEIWISSKQEVLVPRLGLAVTSVNAWWADHHGIKPWEGVLVSEVEADSSAAMAGLRVGDLILSINGDAIRSREQFGALVSDSLSPGGGALLEVSRPVGDSEREVTVLDLAVGSHPIEHDVNEQVSLPLDRGLVASTGLGVGTISSELAEDIYGTQWPTALVAAVVTGSPAYFAGVRAGDRILKANGRPVETVEDLRRQIERGDGTLDLVVEGPLGLHSATFEIQEDVLVDSDFYIPIIVDYESEADRESLRVLEFIFLFGYKHDVRYLPSRTRSVRKSKSVSILPLNMFEFTRTPKKRTNRIFWFISWSSKA